MRKILKVTPPTEEHGLYRIHFREENGIEYYSDMTKNQYKVFELKEQLKKEGANPKTINDFEDAVMQVEYDNRIYDND